MSKVVIRIASSRPAVLAAAMAASGRSLAELAERVRIRGPLAEFLLFGNDHEEVAGKLRTLVARLLAEGETVEIFQMERDEVLGALQDEAACALTPELLERVLAAHEEGLRRIKLRDSGAAGAHGWRFPGTGS